METYSEWPPGDRLTTHERAGYLSGKEIDRVVEANEISKEVRVGAGMTTGVGVGLGGEEVGGDEVVGGGVGGAGDEVVGGGVGDGLAGSTLLITQRCRPPRSLLAKNTASMEQSAFALRKRLQPFVERSIRIIRYVPSSPSTGTNRNIDLPRVGSIVATSEAVPRHACSSRAFTDPVHLREKQGYNRLKIP